MYHRISLKVGGLIFFTVVLLVAIVLILRLQRYNFVTLLPDQLIRTDDYVGGIAISPDGNIALTRPLFQFIELHSGQIYNPEAVDAWQYSVAISPDGNSFVTANFNGESQLWDMKTRTVLKPLNVYDAQDMLFAPDRNHVFAKDEDGVIQREDLRTGDRERIFGPESKITIPKYYGYVSEPNRLAISSDGKDLVIAFNGGTYVWSLQTLSERFFTPECTSAAVSSDDSLLATAGGDLNLWDFRTGQHLQKLVAAKQDCALYHTAFSSDDKFLVASMVGPAEFPSHVMVWQLGDFSHYLVFSAHKCGISAISFIPGTHKIVTCAKDHTLCVWDLDKLNWSDKK
jgi:WD40 repeat protein